MKSFGDILGESWKEYKKNWKVYTPIYILLAILPMILYLVFTTAMTYDFSNVNPMDVTSFSQVLNLMAESSFFIPVATSLLLMTILGIFLSVSLYYNVLYKKETMSFGETLKGGSQNFLKYLGYWVVKGIFLIGLFILLIIPGIIFSVYWVFAGYILVGEKRGVIGSLKQSFRIVRGKWWRTLGFLLLFGLIYAGIMIGVDIATGIINTIITIPYAMQGLQGIEPELPFVMMLLTIMISNIGTWIVNIIFLPFGTLFMKNLYLDMKPKGDKKEKKK